MRLESGAKSKKLKGGGRKSCTHSEECESVDIHEMKNVNIVRIVLFLGLLWSGLPLHARTVVFENGVKIDLPIYKNKQVNPDGAVCVWM